MVLLLLSSAQTLQMTNSSLEPNPFLTNTRSRSVMIKQILTNFTLATLRTFCAYVFGSFLVSVELSRLTSSESEGVVFIALILWSIVFPLRSLAILSLLHILLIPKFLQMLLAAVATIYLLHYLIVTL